MAYIASLFLLLLLFLFLLRRCLVIITVYGRSMEPTLVAGDRVLLLRFWSCRLLRQGGVTIFFSGNLALRD
jgi:signal peptidase I